MACSHFMSDCMLHLSIIVSTRCLLHYPEAHTFTRNSHTCRVLSALCSAWTPCAAPTLKLGSGCVHVPHAQAWDGHSCCRVRMLHLWEDVHSLHVPCVHNLWNFQGGPQLHFSRYEESRPHNSLRHCLHYFIIIHRVCSFGHQMILPYYVLAVLVTFVH